MAIVNYIDLPQCEPTSRSEITKVLSEVSENGVIRGRVMHQEPTYELSLSHLSLDQDRFALWEQFWADHYNDEIRVTWVADGVEYQGIFRESPSVSYAPHMRFDVGVVLLVKKRPPIVVTSVAPGQPGYWLPATAPIPQDLSSLQALGSLGSAAPWYVGEWVWLGDGSDAYWDGAAWVAGKSLVPSGIVAGTPGSYQPVGAIAPPTLAMLQYWGTLPGGDFGNTAAWTTGEYIILGDASEAHWDGSLWMFGRAL